MKQLNKNWKGIGLFLLPAGVLYSLFFIIPLGFVFYVSLQSWNGISAMEFIGLTNYRNLFQNPTFILGIRNNFIWAMALAFIQVPLAALIAMILTRKPRGWRFLRTVYFLPNVISQVAIAMLWISIYNAEYGAINQFLTMIGLEDLTQNWLGQIETALPAVIIQQVLYIGYFMIILLAATMSIPESFYEAAQLDGANVFQQDWYITLPMIKSIMVVCMTLAISYGLRHFEATFLMTNGGPANSTMVMGLHLYRRTSSLDYGQANAVGTTLILVGGTIIVVIRRLFSRRDKAADAVQ